MQEYRYSLITGLAILSSRTFELFGVRRPLRYERVPTPAGEYDEALHVDHPEAPSLLIKYLEPQTEPRLGGKPNETASGPD
jgi:hypothetical protein